MKEIIRFGILGYARIARNAFIPAIRFLPQTARLSAVGVESDSSFQKASEELTGVKVVRGYRELLEDPEIDAVYIALPNHLHLPWILEALRRGKHVLCEKPLALSASEAETIRKEASRRKLHVAEAFMYLHTPRIQKALDIVRQGKLGEIRRVDASFRFFLDNPDDYRWKWSSGGGSLYDVGCYPVSFFTRLFECLPENIAGVSRMKNGVDAGFSAVMTYPSSAIARLDCGFDTDLDCRIEIAGEKTTLEIPGAFLPGFSDMKLRTGLKEETIETAEVNPYTEEIRSFCSTLLGEIPPFLPLENSVMQLRLIGLLKKHSRKIKS